MIWAKQSTFSLFKTEFKAKKLFSWNLGRTFRRAVHIKPDLYLASSVCSHFRLFFVRIDTNIIPLSDFLNLDLRLCWQLEWVKPDFFPLQSWKYGETSRHILICSGGPEDWSEGLSSYVLTLKCLALKKSGFSLVQ